MPARLSMPCHLLGLLLLLLLVGCATKTEYFDRPASTEWAPRPDLVTRQMEVTPANGRAVIKVRETTLEQEVTVLQKAATRTTVPIEPGDAGMYVMLDVLPFRWYPFAVIGAIAGFIEFPGWALGLNDEVGASYLFPVWDLVGRLFGHGLRVSGQMEDFGSNDEIAAAFADDYWANLLDWFGWFIPFYPVLGVAAGQATVETVDVGNPIRRPTGATREASRYLTAEEIRATMRFRANEREVVALAADANSVEVGLDQLLDTTVSSDLVLIEGVPRSGMVLAAARILQARDFGVTRNAPREWQGEPAILYASLKVTDESGDGVIQPGERGELILAVNNLDTRRAWALQGDWIDPALPGLDWEGPASVVREALDPNANWEARRAFRARPTWTASGQVQFGARFSDLSRPGRDVAPAVVAVEPYDPPPLSVVVAVTDASGNNILEAGEQATARLTVVNNGRFPAYDTTLEWQAPTGVGLQVTGDRSMSVPTIEPGGTRTMTLELRADEEWTWGAEVVVGATVRRPAGPAPAIEPARLVARAFSPPKLLIEQVAWIGGRTGQLSPGDAIVMNVGVLNEGTGGARGVVLEVVSTDQRVRVTNDPEAVTIDAASFHSFSVPVQIQSSFRAEAGTPLPLELRLREARPQFSLQPAPVNIRIGDRAAGAATIDLAQSAAAVRERQATDARLREAEERMRAAEARLAEARRLEEQAAEAERQRQERERTERDRIAALQRERQQREQERQSLRGRSFAVIVGINQYDEADQITALNYAVADAKLLHRTLTDAETGLFSADNVLLLTSDDSSPAKWPTKANIVTALYDIGGRLQEGDRFLFFFAGHGVTIKEQNYLLAKDSRWRVEALRTSMSLNLTGELLDLFGGFKATEQILIVDACHSGLERFVRTGPGSDERAIGRISYERVRTEIERSGNTSINRAFLSSSAKDQVSHEDPALGHGVFTYFLTRAVQLNPETKRPFADGNFDGVISAEEMFNYTQNEVAAWCRRAGKSNAQVPSPIYYGRGNQILVSKREVAP